MSQPLRKRPLYRILTWAVFLAGLVLLGKMSSTLAAPEYLPADDYGHFWAAGKLNLQGEDPYDPEKILALLYQVGRPRETSGSVVSVMLNPPWTLPLVMPFALLGYPLSRMVWLLANIAVMILCAEQIWQIYGGAQNQRWVAWLLTFALAPTIATLQKGQFAPLILFGLVGFLKWHRQPEKWLATGAILALATTKPQLVYLLWLALLFWCIRTRNWKIVAGCTLALGAALVVAMAANAEVVAQYRNNLARFPLSSWAVPTFGAYLRYWLGLEKFWLQFIPMLAGMAWFLYQWAKERSTWDWVEKTPLLLFVSLLTAPYSWTYDLVLILPAILLAGITLFKKRPSAAVWILWICYALLNIADMILHRWYDEFWFGWLAPGLLIWYLVIRGSQALHIKGEA